MTRERFWAKVDTNGPVPEQRPELGSCWIWTASSGDDGYGQFEIGSRIDGSRRRVKTHRFAYEDLIGSIPEGLVLDHLCRVRHCVNPAHLEPVTHRENVLRGQGFSAENARKTHCINGHAFTGENTRQRRTRRGRVCRVCHREEEAKRRRRLAEKSAA